MDALERVLPTDDSHNSKNQRQKVWELCDKNSNGFINLNDIQEELCRNLNIQSQPNIREIVFKSSEEVKKKFQIKGSFGKEYLEKKQLRAYIIFLKKHLISLKIFQSLDKNGDNQIEEQELIAATKLLTKWDVDQQKRLLAKALTLEKKLTFNKFQEWLDTFEYYDVKDLDKMK